MPSASLFIFPWAQLQQEKKINQRIQNDDFLLCFCFATVIEKDASAVKVTHLKVDAPGHDQRGQQQVWHSQRDDEVVGGGLQGALPRHGHAHQHVAEDHAEDEEHQQHRVEVVGPGGVQGRVGAVGRGQPGEGRGRGRGVKDGEIQLQGGGGEGGRGDLRWPVQQSHDVAQVDMVSLLKSMTQRRREKKLMTSGSAMDRTPLISHNKSVLDTDNRGEFKGGIKEKVTSVSRNRRPSSTSGDNLARRPTWMKTTQRSTSAAGQGCLMFWRPGMEHSRIKRSAWSGQFVLCLWRLFYKVT